MVSNRAGNGQSAKEGKCRPEGGPPTASPAERVAVGSEEIPCPAKKPRRQAGHGPNRAGSGQARRKETAARRAAHQLRAQRSGSQLEAKKFPVQLRSPAFRRVMVSNRAGNGQRATEGKCRPEGGPPTASPAERVAVGKEEQGSGRMTSFLPQAQKDVGAKRTLLRRGTPGATRTHYIPLRRRTLYPGEVRGQVVDNGFILPQTRPAVNGPAEPGRFFLPPEGAAPFTGCARSGIIKPFVAAATSGEFGKRTVREVW